MTYYLVAAAIFAVVLLFVIGVFRAVSNRMTFTGRHKNALRMKFAGVLVAATSISLFLVLAGWDQTHPGFYNPADFPAAPHMKYVAALVAVLFIGILMLVRGHRVATLEEHLRRQRVNRIKSQRRQDNDRHLRVVAS